VEARLNDSHEAAEQIAFADVILLNKADLVPEGELVVLETRIRAMNPTAVIHRTERCAVPVGEVMGRRAFDLDRILAIEPDFLGEDAHEHDDNVKSVALRETRPLDPDKFNSWIRTLIAAKGQSILRSKGILDIKDSPNRLVFQGVHMLIEGGDGKVWANGETHDSKIVFIGRDLDAAALTAGFTACIA
jgi:G3E family GTPase